jgi:alanine-synthesizing transaminase
MFARRTNWNLTSNRLSEALAKYRSEGRPLLDLTASNPTECGFEYDRQAILQALSSSESLAYDPDPKGLLSARGAVAGYYSARQINIPTEDIILTISTSEAYSFAFRVLCNADDELLIPEPSYPLFSFLAGIHDVKLASYPLLYDHGWQIDFHALQSAITRRTRGVIVVHPNNPTGHFCKSGEIEKLNEICSPRQMAIIADEVFLDYHLAATQPRSFAANTGSLTFTLSGLSKISGLPQMKAAWLISSGPDELKTQALARVDVIADTFLSMNTPVQLALPAFLELRHGFREQLMNRVRKNLAELDRQLSSQNSCVRLEVEGGWYAVVRVPAIRSDEELAIELLNKHGVYVHPGHFYDFPTDGYLIVSLITTERDFKEGIKRMLATFYLHESSPNAPIATP